MISPCCPSCLGPQRLCFVFVCVTKPYFGTGGESVCAKVTLADADLTALALSHVCATDLAHAHVKRKEKQSQATR